MGYAIPLVPFHRELETLVTALECALEYVESDNFDMALRQLESIGENLTPADNVIAFLSAKTKRVVVKSVQKKRSNNWCPVVDGGVGNGSNVGSVGYRWG